MGSVHVLFRKDLILHAVYYLENLQQIPDVQHVARQESAKTEKVKEASGKASGYQSCFLARLQLFFASVTFKTT